LDRRKLKSTEKKEEKNHPDIKNKDKRKRIWNIRKHREGNEKHKCEK
jgi:hypothetical protein